MKIDQLSRGVRFEYKGEEYIKTGPMIGTGPNGPQVIPRSAILKPIASAEVVETMLPRADVLREFDTFYTDCQTLVPDEQHDSLALLRDRFLKSLEGLR